MVLLRRAIWKTKQGLEGQVLPHLRALRRWQWSSRDECRHLQEERLSALLRHAYGHVPYYRQVLADCGVVVDGNVHLGRFTELPLLDKAAIREAKEGLHSDDLMRRRVYRNSSGGSTGEPIQLLQDKTYRDWMTAVKILFDEWTGYRLGERKLILWGSERDLKAVRRSWFRRVGEWARNEHRLNAFCMTPDDMRAYAAEITAFDPRQLLAYAESLYELARFIEREGLETCPPHAIMTSAGTLSPEMRGVIERVFRAKVFNRYGSREVGDIACESEAHDGMLICAPTHYVELLGPDGAPVAPGEAGEVVITNLVNFAMPLIRYRIGDMAEWAGQESGCGRHWPLLRGVTGRVSDYFTRVDGARVRIPTAFFSEEPWIRKYQVIQEELSRVRLLIVADGPTPRDRLELVMDRIRQLMGETCRIEFEEVDDIAPSASGKYRYSISKVTEQAGTERH